VQAVFDAGTIEYNILDEMLSARKAAGMIESIVGAALAAIIAAKAAPTNKLFL